MSRKLHVPTIIYILVIFICCSGCEGIVIDIATDQSTEGSVVSSPGLATHVSPMISLTPWLLAPTSTQMPMPSVLATLPYTSTIPAPSFSPTLNATQEYKLVKSLTSLKCELPCYLGITPGETSWEAAQEILSDLGAYSWVETYQIGDPKFDITDSNGWPIYTYHLNTGDPLSIYPRQESLRVSWVVSQMIELTVGHDRVERILVSLTYLRRGENEAAHWWINYSLKNIIKSLGEPDSIYFEPISREYPSYTVYLVYEDVRAVFEYRGLSKDESSSMICPLLPDGVMTGQRMNLTNSASPLKIVAPNKPSFLDRPDIQPIKDVLGIDAREFTARLLADPSACFQVSVIQD